jgi:hypothetical protein
MDAAPVESMDLQLRRAVRDALCEAMARQTWVTVYLFADLERNVPIREYGGVPVSFVPAKDGSERVVLTIAEGDSNQIIRVDRIARVMFNALDSA